MSQTPSSSTTSSSSSTPQNTCQVSNNIVLPTSPTTPAQSGWTGDISVISGYNNSTTTSTDFQQSSLTLLSFIDEGSSSSSLSSTSTTTLPNTKVGTLNLLPYYQPGSTTLVNSSYNLLVCQSNNYFPLCSVGELKTGKSFAPIAVPQAAPCNSSSAANAYVFLQNMMAFPSSPLAQQFTSAMNGATSATSSAAVSTNVNNFFASTTSFQNVTFDVYTAVSSYASAYAYVWANFQTTYTYNFYTVTPNSTASSSTDSTDVTVNEQVKSLGTIVFSLTGSIPAAIDDANAGYTITWNPTGQSPVSLSFSDGQLIAPNASGFSGLCLQCTFADMAAFTGNSADSGTPIQALTGTINGQNVIGSPVQLQEDVAANIQGGLSDVLTSKVFEALQIGIALYMGIELSVKLACWIKAKFKSGETPTKEEISSTQDKLQEKSEEKLEDTGNKEPVETGENLTESQISAESSVLNSETEVEERLEINEQYSEEESQLELEDNSSIEDEVSETNEEESDLDEIDPESVDASSQLDSIQSSLSANQANIVSENQALGQASSASVEQQENTETELESDEANDEKEEDEDEDGDLADDAGDLADL